ncbi:hypothetical protein HPO_19190 [Hyphomonas polymorpha PS728]|uniref:Uncharacterized protein n=1 Tax=Hyphomonas polymorpha PS728 TaxID=1280954 RepID=A0A062VB73_9PROT|nr:hypothetical protein [Hyphomonas polymorpha]KCZ96574.1 hypothetical protein HPO_19190 [Hyphomonas polymorpha PS728]
MTEAEQMKAMSEELPLFNETFLRELDRVISGDPNWDEEAKQYHTRALKMRTLGFAGYMYFLHQEDEALRLGDKETSDEMEELLDEIASMEQRWDLRPDEVLIAVRQICVHWENGPNRGICALLSLRS